MTTEQGAALPTAEVDGRQFVARIETHAHRGCVAEHDINLCGRLPVCWTKDTGPFVWEEVKHG